MELLKMYFIKKGLDAKCTGENEAISEMNKFKPDVVIVDVMQIEAAKSIKQNQHLSHIPIVLMTGHTFIQNDYTKVADEVIYKPFEPKRNKKRF